MLMYILIAVTGSQDPRATGVVQEIFYKRMSLTITDSETSCVIFNNIEVRRPPPVLWCSSVYQLIMFLLFTILTVLT